MWHDAISGGKADHKKPSDFSRDQIHAGMLVEREHAKNPRLQKEIAMDHLTEDEDYYRKLKLTEPLPLAFVQRMVAQYKRIQEKTAGAMPAVRDFAGNYALTHVLGGAAGGAILGGALSKEDRKKGALRGAMLGAAGGLGSAERVSDMFKKRLERIMTENRSAGSRLKNMLTSDSSQRKRLAQKWESLHKAERPEYMARMGMGGITGAGLTELGSSMVRKLREEQNNNSAAPKRKRRLVAMPIYR